MLFFKEFLLIENIPFYTKRGTKTILYIFQKELRNISIETLEDISISIKDSEDFI